MSGSQKEVLEFF